MTFDMSNLKATEGQRALAAYIKRETGKQVKPESIALVDALRTEFRKDPEQVAARDAVKAAARERDEAKLEKALATAKALAAKLGHPVEGVQHAVSGTVAVESGAKQVEPVTPADVTPEADEGFDEPADEPIATVTSIGSKRVVENEFGADTSAIVTVDAEDGFTAPADTGEVEDF